MKKKPAPKKKAPKPAPHKVKKPVPVKRQPRSQRLPGITHDDTAIAEIEDAAFDYRDAITARMQAGKVEQDAHAVLVSAMRKHKKAGYHHNTGEFDIDVRMTVKDPEQKAKVKIRTAEDAADEPTSTDVPEYDPDNFDPEVPDQE